MLPIAIILGLAAGVAVNVIIIVSGWIIIRRRPPDPADSPANHGLPFEDVSFPSKYKANLQGWWIPSDDARGTIIFCHGQNGSMDADLPLAAMIHQAGYNVLMFNFRAHGTSEGKHVTFGVFEKEDLLGAIDFLRAEKGVERVGVFGLSMGAAVAMIAAALTDKISVLILDGAFTRFLTAVQFGIRERGIPPPVDAILAQMAVLGASIHTNTRMYQVSPHLWAKHIDNVPALFIHGEYDPFAPLTAMNLLASDLNGPNEIWVALVCKHREAFQKHPDLYKKQVLGWLEKYCC
jgi:pimeloyl-ACP methyl ester carboxylesterase